MPDVRFQPPPLPDLHISVFLSVFEPLLTASLRLRHPEADWSDKCEEDGIPIKADAMCLTERIHSLIPRNSSSAPQREVVIRAC